MAYSDSISINKNFQASINLELDLGNEKKIDEYIPTTDICDVIKKYIKASLGDSKDFSTILVGPYGKGKSFLLLILIFLLGKNKETKTWINLVNKIKKIDLELYELLQEIKNKNINLLPIIINSNYDDISQSFRLALNDSLKNFKLDDIIPNSVFDMCISLLDKWENSEDLKENLFKKCIELNNINLLELRRELKNCSAIAYRQFEKLYNCLNVGLAFNPLINNDVVKTYAEILIPLNKKGYNGIFIVFDEFSKFLERNSSNLMKDLKIVQDFAELASRSGRKNQIHFCCVTHKSIGLYKTEKKNININDSFKTVEGRFKEIRFNRSLNENYQLISSAFTRKDNLYNELSDFIRENNEFIKNMGSLPAFKDENLQKILFKESFPLNPLTVYSLVHICEKVAQNERTLFTFLSDTDDDSFNSFIHSESYGLFNVDKVYDYFNQLLKREDSSEIQNIWYRTESILSKLENINEKKVIKALSIITIINNFDELPPTEKIISLSLELSSKDTVLCINSLIEKHYIRENLITHYLSFALSSSKQIDETIAVLKNTKLKDVKFSDIANELNEKKNILPRQYNEENKITRFYNVIFLSEQEFLKIPSYNYYFEENYCDGLIINLFNKSINENQIIEKLKSINDLRIVVRYPKKEIENAFFESLKYFACLKEMLKQKGFDEIAQTQINLMIDEIKSDCQSLINDYFEKDFKYCYINKTNSSNFNKMLSDIMSNIYSYKLIFNNELMNKKQVTTQYQKAINHVIDWLLDDKNNFPFSDTSPEFSVKYAVFDFNDEGIKSEYGKNFRKLIDLIKDKLLELNGEKISVKELLRDLSIAPYGIRDGVIPLIFAKSISELSDNAIIYYQQKEVELNSLNIVKSIKNENYQISFAKGSIDQKEYLNDLLKLFDVNIEDNFRTNTFNLAKKIKSFFAGLPQILRTCTKKNNFLSLDEKFIDYKNLFMSFDINPYECIFVKSLEIFKTDKYSKAYDYIEKIVNGKNNLLVAYSKKLICLIKEIFEISSESSLKSGFKEFLNNNLKENEKPIFEKKYKELFDFINLRISYDDAEGLNKMAKIITSQYIEDWDNDKSYSFIEELKKFKLTLMNSRSISSTSNSLENSIFEIKEIKGMSVLLKNNIESILEEFSGSITNEDKANVLASLLKDLL